MNRFYIQDGVYGAFAERLARRVRALKVGDGLETGVQHGPPTNEATIGKVAAHVEDAVAKGDRILAGGRRHELGGTFFEPTVTANAFDDMLVAHEERFGPLWALFCFAHEQTAIDTANATEDGLAAYFYTNDFARTFRVARALQTGMIGINEGLTTTEVAPFGGVKDSGIGRRNHGIFQPEIS